MFNSVTVSGVTGFAPSVMVFGSENAGKSFLDLGNIALPHNSIKNNKVHVDQLTTEIAECKASEAYSVGTGWGAE